MNSIASHILLILMVADVLGFSSVSFSQRPIHLQPFPARKLSPPLQVLPNPSLITISRSCFSSISKYILSSHQDFMFVLSSLFVLSTFGLFLERKTTIGKSLSAPLATMATSLVVANMGLIPFESQVYEFINRYLVTLAVPMLLFDSNMSRVVTFTGPLLRAFLLGSLATIVGTFVAFPLVPLKSLGYDQGWKVACALAARHIGGAINFVAVSESLNVAGSVVSAAIAADNVVIALYFAFLFYLAIPGESDNTSHLIQVDSPVDPENIAADDKENSSISMMSIAKSITVASCIVCVSKACSKVLLPPGISALPLISVMTVAAATIFPSYFGDLRSSGTALGVFFMQLFFAASGATGSIGLVLKSAPSLFLFSVIQIAAHFLVLVSLGRLFRLDMKYLLLSSNANVGGPTTAAAMAQAKDWNRLIVPALLVGILGYAIATPIGLIIGPFLSKIIT